MAAATTTLGDGRKGSDPWSWRPQGSTQPRRRVKERRGSSFGKGESLGETVQFNGWNTVVGARRRTRGEDSPLLNPADDGVAMHAQFPGQFGDGERRGCHVGYW